MSPFNTATLPGMITFLDFTLSSTFSLKNLEIELPENLPAAQDVSTESPPASLITRFTGTPDLSSSPEWGNQEVRGISMEIQTAAASLASGSDAVILKHPQSVATISKMIQELM